MDKKLEVLYTKSIVFTSLKNLILELVFPYLCVGCNKEGTPLCPTCRASLVLHNSVMCPVCKKRIPGPEPAKWKCSTIHTKNPLSFVIYATTYESKASQQLVRTLKYRGVRSSAPIIENYIREALTPYVFKNFIATSVPLYPHKYRLRGFNQSELLARASAMALDIPYCNLLSKIKDTKSQTELSLQERKTNIHNAFIVYERTAVKNKNILIVDDVFTSGATLQECARILKQHGAHKVGAVVFAR